MMSNDCNIHVSCVSLFIITDANEMNMYQIYFVCYDFIQLSTQLFISLVSQIASNGYISVWLILQWLLLVLNIPRNIRSFRIKHIPCIMPVNMFGISPGVIVMIVSCNICQCVFMYIAVSMEMSACGERAGAHFACWPFTLTTYPRCLRASIQQEDTTLFVYGFPL